MGAPRQDEQANDMTKVQECHELAAIAKIRKEALNRNALYAFFATCGIICCMAHNGPRRGITPGSVGIIIGAVVAGGFGGYALSDNDEPQPASSDAFSGYALSSDIGQASDDFASETDSNVYYRYCNDARAAAAAPIYRGEPGYRDALDRDNDGIACEPYRGY